LHRREQVVLSLRLPGILDELWGPPAAVTAAHEGRANGLISTTAIAASLFAETPRVLVALTKTNLTHDLVLASGAFAVHLLPPDSLDLVRALGMRTGRAGDKLAGFDWRPGVTGSPILARAVGFAEARIASTFDAGELTLALGDVLAQDRTADAYLTNALLAETMPPEMREEWELRREQEQAAAAKMRGPAAR
jgi:flavin reductase (DIM6/NTAB) family NADH-FMN oxidoreductase RutF